MSSPRRLWQRAMIGLATNEWLQRVMQRRAARQLLAHRFVAAEDAETGARIALKLPAEGISSSLFYLGEYIHDPSHIEQTVLMKIAAAEALRSLNLDVHISLDPTQIGGSIDFALCRRNFMRIAAAIAEGTADGSREHVCLMLDMEDAEVVDATIDLHDQALLAGHPVAITLQAYLRRTKDDLALKMTQGAFVRLVKGAFAAGSDIAYTSRRRIRQGFLALAETALSSPERHPAFYVSFATHDEKIHREIERLAAVTGRSRDTFEFEMLYGVRDDLAARLARAGYRVRLYMPFGTDWWPYALRRVGENPRHVLMLARALLTPPWQALQGGNARVKT